MTSISVVRSRHRATASISTRPVLGRSECSSSAPRMRPRCASSARRALRRPSSNRARRPRPPIMQLGSGQCLPVTPGRSDRPRASTSPPPAIGTHANALGMWYISQWSSPTPPGGIRASHYPGINALSEDEGRSPRDPEQWPTRRFGPARRLPIVRVRSPADQRTMVATRSMPLFS